MTSPTRTLLTRITRGEAGPQSTAELFASVYDELRQLAARYVRDGGVGQTLQPTAVVHEAFVKLVGAEVSTRDREHFLAIAAKAMREILIDAARRRRADKRGGDRRRVTLAGLELVGRDDDIELVALDDALRRLQELDERQAKIVELRFFGGMTGQEIATMMDVSRNTVVRDLAMARAWLARELDGASERGGADDVQARDD